ncbi:hypothetical protein NDU88_001366 [Pleurodeles waltl]|uniref:Uncharacterized protein n=1 Tax=Pleurodeles waltl TaxID=8319 RepID=A0AAV7MLB0_PLEWA|nr:hypothetical protein NDU88_001366 [Pleurodeles waltl]
MDAAEGSEDGAPAVQWKQTRMSVTGRLGTLDEVKPQHEAKREPTRRPLHIYYEYWALSGDEPSIRKESLQQQLPDMNGEGGEATVQETLDNLRHANGEDLMLIATLDKYQGDNFFSLSDQ